MPRGANFKVAVFINPTAIERIVRKDPRASLLCGAAAEKVVEAARAVYLAQQHLDNEFETSETTPPKYLGSFEVRKNHEGRYGFTWHAANNDPAAMWVEFGAHAGGETPVLRYKPLTRGLNIVGGASG